MNTQEILSALDNEIARLQSVRHLLGHASEPKRRGRPSAFPNHAVAKKRVLSPEARKRIAEAQRKRWAALKKQKP